MEPLRRFVFHGSATGVSMHIRRPVDMLMPVQAASALPVTGGHWESRVGPVQWGQRTPPAVKSSEGITSLATTYVSFDSALTSVTGRHTDSAACIAMTLGTVAYADVPAETTVFSEVSKLAVIGRFSVDITSMQLRSQSAQKGETNIFCAGSRLEGVSVDGYGLNITLATEFFDQYNTFALLAEAAKSGSPAGCFLHTSPSLLACTLVTDMRWSGAAHPEASIDGNALIVPNFGKVYFAEMFVRSSYRRLTMVRFQLGSDDGGEGGAGEGETNGEKYPPDAP
jgi:hypothetical protein